MTIASYQVFGCLVILRGLPGSGKSTLAKLMMQSTPGAAHYEADMAHMVDGEYKFNPSKIGDAHAWCQQQAIRALFAISKEMSYPCHARLHDLNAVIVSNTSTKVSEFSIYIEVASQLGIPVRVIRCTGEYESIHGVPADIIERMAERFEDYPGEVLYP